MLHAYLPYEIIGAISAVGFAARMYFKKRPDSIAAKRCPPDKLPELTRAMHGLPESDRPPSREDAKPADGSESPSAVKPFKAG